MLRPLLVLPEARVQQELRRAAAENAYDRSYRRRRRRMLLACAIEFAAGIWLLALADHVYGQDAGMALFWAGILVGYLGPYWTLLMCWRKQDLS